MNRYLKYLRVGVAVFVVACLVSAASGNPAWAAGRNDSAAQDRNGVYSDPNAVSAIPDRCQAGNGSFDVGAPAQAIDPDCVKAIRENFQRSVSGHYTDALSPNYNLDFFSKGQKIDTGVVTVKVPTPNFQGLFISSVWGVYTNMTQLALSLGRWTAGSRSVFAYLFNQVSSVTDPITTQLWGRPYAPSVFALFLISLVGWLYLREKARGKSAGTSGTNVLVGLIFIGLGMAMTSSFLSNFVGISQSFGNVAARGVFEITSAATGTIAVKSGAGSDDGLAIAALPWKRCDVDRPVADITSPAMVSESTRTIARIMRDVVARNPELHGAVAQVENKLVLLSEAAQKYQTDPSPTNADAYNSVYADVAEAAKSLGAAAPLVAPILGVVTTVTGAGDTATSDAKTAADKTTKEILASFNTVTASYLQKWYSVQDSGNAIATAGKDSDAALGTLESVMLLQPWARLQFGPTPVGTSKGDGTPDRGLLESNAVGCIDARVFLFDSQSRWRYLWAQDLLGKLNDGTLKTQTAGTSPGVSGGVPTTPIGSATTTPKEIYTTEAFQKLRSAVNWMYNPSPGEMLYVGVLWLSGFTMLFIMGGLSLMSIVTQIFLTFSILMMPFRCVLGVFPTHRKKLLDSLAATVAYLILFSMMQLIIAVYVTVVLVIMGLVNKLFGDGNSLISMGISALLLSGTNIVMMSKARKMMRSVRAAAGALSAKALNGLMRDSKISPDVAERLQRGDLLLGNSLAGKAMRDVAFGGNEHDATEPGLARSAFAAPLASLGEYGNVRAQGTNLKDLAKKETAQADVARNAAASAEAAFLEDIQNRAANFPEGTFRDEAQSILDSDIDHQAKLDSLDSLIVAQTGLRDTAFAEEQTDFDKASLALDARERAIDSETAAFEAELRKNGTTGDRVQNSIFKADGSLAAGYSLDATGNATHSMLGVTQTPPPGWISAAAIKNHRSNLDQRRAELARDRKQTDTARNAAVAAHAADQDRLRDFQARVATHRTEHAQAIQLKDEAEERARALRAEARNQSRIKAAARGVRVAGRTVAQGAQHDTAKIVDNQRKVFERQTGRKARQSKRRGTTNDPSGPDEI